MLSLPPAFVLSQNQTLRLKVIRLSFLTDVISQRDIALVAFQRKLTKTTFDTDKSASKRFHYFHKEKRHKQSFNKSSTACYQVCITAVRRLRLSSHIHNVKQLSRAKTSQNKGPYEKARTSQHPSKALRDALYRQTVLHLQHLSSLYSKFVSFFAFFSFQPKTRLKYEFKPS